MCNYLAVRRKEYREGKIAYKHQMVVELEGCDIPEGHEVHHLDGDRYNNNLENLVVLPIESHQWFHGGQ